MKKTFGKIRIMKKLGALAAAALAVNLLAAACIYASPASSNEGRYLAQAPDPFITEIGLATEEQATPDAALYTGETPGDPCAALRDNVQISSSPLTTISDGCVTAVVTEGTIALDFIPDSFSFPIKHTSSYPQDSFSNDDPDTQNIDISTGPEDLLTLHDFRGNGGFSVTITSSAFESATASIPLKNLFIATSYPDEDDFAVLDPSLSGAQNGGVEYAGGSNGAQDVTASASTESVLDVAENYTVNFDNNDDGTPDVIELMNTSTGHVGRFSQALNFMLKIPPNQPAGAYQVKFTIDLIY